MSTFFSLPEKDHIQRLTKPAGVRYIKKLLKQFATTIQDTIHYTYQDGLYDCKINVPARLKWDDIKPLVVELKSLGYYVRFDYIHDNLSKLVIRWDSWEKEEEV